MDILLIAGLWLDGSVAPVRGSGFAGYSEVGGGHA